MLQPEEEGAEAPAQARAGLQAVGRAGAGVPEVERLRQFRRSAGLLVREWTRMPCFLMVQITASVLLTADRTVSCMPTACAPAPAEQQDKASAARASARPWEAAEEDLKKEIWGRLFSEYQHKHEAGLLG
jgi:hypothetical protein